MPAKRIWLVAFAFIFLFMLFLLAGCQHTAPAVNMPADSVAGAGGTGDERFEIIYEHGETMNMGGFTVIRDNLQGVEYLVITGLNGAPAVIRMDSGIDAGAE